jgi:hypothetical protein
MAPNYERFFFGCFKFFKAEVGHLGGGELTRRGQSQTQQVLTEIATTRSCQPFRCPSFRREVFASLLCPRRLLLLLGVGRARPPCGGVASARGGAATWAPRGRNFVFTQGRRPLRATSPCGVCRRCGTVGQRCRGVAEGLYTAGAVAARREREAVNSGCSSGR